MIPNALTIAGSDSSGGAGIQADLKTFSALGVYGASVVTALTAQNTQGVHAIHRPPVAFIEAQLDAVFGDLRIAATKIGMVGSAAAIAAIAAKLRGSQAGPIVLDPVMVAGSGDPLLEAGAEQALISQLMPLADLITPNLDEAARLLGCEKAADEDEMERQALALRELGRGPALLTGGHMEGAEAVDFLADDTGAVRLSAGRVATSNTHGSGCTLSAAIAGYLALGLEMRVAVERAKAFVARALSAADALDVGRGAGPVNHLVRVDRSS
jgi:hydroxymethylpyrimidine/phosphomethylpyrimidine kinase